MFAITATAIPNFQVKRADISFALGMCLVFKNP